MTTKEGLPLTIERCYVGMKVLPFRNTGHTSNGKPVDAVITRIKDKEVIIQDRIRGISYFGHYPNNLGAGYTIRPACLYSDSKKPTIIISED